MIKTQETKLARRSGVFCMAVKWSNNQLPFRESVW
jgi:hypothetical protein